MKSEDGLGERIQARLAGWDIVLSKETLQTLIPRRTMLKSYFVIVMEVCPWVNTA